MGIAAGSAISTLFGPVRTMGPYLAWSARYSCVAAPSQTRLMRQSGVSLARKGPGRWRRPGLKNAVKRVWHSQSMIGITAIVIARFLFSWYMVGKQVGDFFGGGGCRFVRWPARALKVWKATPHWRTYCVRSLQITGKHDVPRNISVVLECPRDGNMDLLWWLGTILPDTR